MLEIKEKEEKLVSTSELAKMLNTTNNVILSVARKNGIEKIVKNGVPIYWNEEEVDTIIKNIDYNNSQAKQALTKVKGSIKTDLMIKEEANNSLNNLISIDELAKILNYDSDYLRKKCKELGFTQNGIKTMLNEQQVENIRKILVPRTLDMKVQGEQIKTSISIKENFLKATQDYIALIESEKEELKKKIEQDKPLVDFANTVSKTYNYISIGEFAKITYKDLKLGSGNMFKFLKTHKILMENNIPYQQYIDAGYFKVKENTFNTAFGVKTYTRTFITGKGQIYLAKKIKNLQQLLNK